MQYDGVNPALFTPLTDDGEAVDVGRLRKLLAWLLPQGISGLFVCGTTGEGIFLSPEERETVVEVTLSEVAGAVPVMVHCGAVATRDSVRLARHAARCGAAAVSSVPPFPLPLQTASVLAHWRQIGAATDLPLWIYYMPAMSAFHLDEGLVEPLLALPNLVGLKFTDANFYVMRNLLDLSAGRLRVLSGPDELFLAARVMGASGAIGSTYNWMAPIFVRILEAVRRGDLASASHWQGRANGFIRLIHRYEKIAGQKVIMEYLGVPCGPSRRPLQPLTLAQQNELFAALDAADLRGALAGGEQGAR
ncbi:MAG: dihydrodipicolinate synthase family protein [Fimbriimonadaceae bacterium]|nr:dihydrodipicolinate synthase family protein [Fimbriimonadaceae bacterium]